MARSCQLLAISLPMGCFAHCSIHNIVCLCYAYAMPCYLATVYPNFAPHSGQNLEEPSVLVPQFVQNLCVPVKVDVNDDAEADDEVPPAMACSAKARAIISSMSINPCSLNIIVLLFLVLSRIGELENWMYKIWRLHDFPIANLLKMFIIYNDQLLFCTKIWNKS